MKDRKPLKEFCDEWRRQKMCDEIDCVDCPFLAGIQFITKHYKTGCTARSAIRTFMHSRVARKKARKIIEEAIGMPLEIAQAILRENE